MDELLTIDDVARICRVHKATIRRHIAAGRLRSVRVGRALRVRRDDLDRFVDRHDEEIEIASLPLPGIQGDHRPFSMDDPLWDIVGISNNPDNWWVSADKYRALADAFARRE